MTNLYDSQITEILPPALAEKEKVQAVSYAISMQIRKLLGYAAATSVYALIDSASEKIVDLLAVELNTQYYDDDLDLDVKRALVKNTLLWYEKVGTPGALQELISAVFGEGYVTEWFEYDGDEFTFRIETTADLTEDMFTLFASLLYRVKNTRSHLEAIYSKSTLENTFYAGSIAAQRASYVLGSDVEEEGAVYIELSALVADAPSASDETEGNSGRTTETEVDASTAYTALALKQRFIQAMEAAE